MTKLNALEHLFIQRKNAVTALAAQIKEQLSNQRAKYLPVSLVLPGGSTPIVLYNELKKQKVISSDVHLAVTDERAVPLNDARSNTKQMISAFDGSCHQQHLEGFQWLNSDSHTHNIRRFEAHYGALPKPINIVLGMGKDGHIASIFPGDSYYQGERSVVFSDQADVGRVGLSMTELLDAEIVYLLFWGSEKWATYSSAKNDYHPKIPVSELLHKRNKPLHIYWAK